MPSPADSDPLSPSAPATGAPFGRTELEQGPKRRLSEGRWANAVLYRYEHRGESWVVKDFSSRAPLVRHVIGRFLIRREFGWLRRVDGLAAAPSGAFRIDAHALAYRFVPGTSLRLTAASALGPEFFPELESSLRALHERARLVHLDLRNAHNILVTDDGRPALLDFQSCLSTRWMPARLRRFLERIDLAAIYKHWARKTPATLGPERTSALARMNRLRPLWVLRGYIGAGRDDRRRG
jgi:RIO-like serine/threonine protein kinase